MKRFFLKVFALCLPFILLLAFPLLVQLKSGELLSAQDVIKQQISKQRQVLYGPAYSNQNDYYKLTMASRLKPEILALGDSKVLGFRAGFFKQPGQFYNANSVIYAPNEFKDFVSALPQKPKLLIINIDPVEYDPGLPTSTSDITKQFTVGSVWDNDTNIFFNSFLSVYTDYFKNKFSLRQLFQNQGVKKIGLTALINGQGIRNDGSYYFGSDSADPTHAGNISRVAHIVDFVQHNGGSPSGNNFSEAGVLQLEDFFNYCQKNNIYVIGYISPQPHAVVEAYKNNPVYAYMFLTDSKIRPLFEKFHFGFFNYFDLASLSAPDSESYDGYHITEKATLRILIKMAQQDPVLQQQVDLKFLQKTLAEAKGQNDVLADPAAN